MRPNVLRPKDRSLRGGKLVKLFTDYHALERMTWSLRRNTDKGLPATHTVEIMFKLPADFPSGGISNVQPLPRIPCNASRAPRSHRD
jgi:hypothetical protein